MKCRLYVALLCSLVAISTPSMKDQDSIRSEERLLNLTKYHLEKPNKHGGDPLNNTEVIAQIGGTAALRCHTLKMPDQLVTWMKRGEEQLLTAGLQVYSSEKRYSVAHLRHQKVWELRIRDVRWSDAGTYECQMTSHPPVALLFKLRVVEAKAVISGPSELHVHEGSRLKLHCHVDLATEPPLYVFWFHNETMINFEAKRPLRVTKQLFGSSLTITNVSRRDAGLYRCEPHLAIADNVTLHVIAGENSAAMQKGSNEEGTHFAQTSDAPTTASIRLPLLALALLGALMYISDFVPIFWPRVDMIEGLGFGKRMTNGKPNRPPVQESTQDHRPSEDYRVVETRISLKALNGTVPSESDGTVPSESDGTVPSESDGTVPSEALTTAVTYSKNIIVSESIVANTAIQNRQASHNELCFSAYR